MGAKVDSFQVVVVFDLSHHTDQTQCVGWRRLSLTSMHDKAPPSGENVLAGHVRHEPLLVS